MSKLQIRKMIISERKILNDKLSDRKLSAYVLDRYRIIQSLSEGLNPTHISRILGCERQTLYNWAHSFNNSDFSEFEIFSNLNGRPATITSENLRQIVNNCTITTYRFRSTIYHMVSWQINRLL
jgi:hypothetical protein